MNSLRMFLYVFACMSAVAIPSFAQTPEPKIPYSIEAIPLRQSVMARSQIRLGGNFIPAAAFSTGSRVMDIEDRLLGQTFCDCGFVQIIYQNPAGSVCAVTVDPSREFRVLSMFDATCRIHPNDEQNRQFANKPR